ncbi:MAG: hypothetical protein AMXMBFR13_38800 [Phycisphaerae bacterium]
MTTTPGLMTADDLWNLPDDGMRHELVRGQLRTMAPAGFEHGGTGMTLGILLGQHVRAKGLGLLLNADTGFLLRSDPDTVRAPDIAFVSRARLDKTGVPKKFFPGAPDLAVEVVSPGDTVDEVEEKVEDYLLAGTRLIWIVNPRRRTVTIRRPGVRAEILKESDQLTGEDVVPGFSCTVGELFPE